jgi:tRNA ligase
VVKNIDPPVRLLALNWSIDQPLAIVHRILSDRIVGRGKNHQALHADTTSARSHEEVIWMFIKNMEELGSDEVDVIVDMDLTQTPAEMLRRAVDACVRELGVPQPSEEQIQEALTVAQGYKPKTTTAPEPKARLKSKEPRYYALLPEIDLGKTLESRIPNAENSPKEFWARLKNQNRVAKQPHITLAHKNNLPEDQVLWDACAAINSAEDPPLFSMRFSTLVWNDRVMALVVDDLASSSDEPDDKSIGANFVVQLPEEVRSRLHVTVGTWTSSIAPVEAKDLVEAWRQGKRTKIGIMPLEGVLAEGRLKGMYG